MSGGPSGATRVSPDGKWWWDGTKWVPMPGTNPNPQALHEPTSQLPAPYQPAAYPPSVYVYGPRSNSLAVASLIFGIISWFLCPFVGGLLAVILGHVAKSQIRRSGEGGGGLATAGLILGYIHLAAFALVAIFWILILGGGLAILSVIGTLPTPTPTP